MDKVTILMATYNGDRFLKELLDSICAQTYSNWELIIRDDCSSDKTCEILSEYKKKDDRIFVYFGKERLGSTGNFGWLAQIKELGNYIMFCDQDDIWSHNKIEITLKEMKRQERINVDTCLLVYCNKQLVDENLIPIMYSRSDSKKQPASFWELLKRNPIYGCTMMINKYLLDKAGKFPQYIQTHDYYYALIAACYGKIVRIPNTLIMYRQHSSNVTGGTGNYGLVNKIKNISIINRKLHETIKQNYIFCKEKAPKNNQYAQIYINIIESNRLIRLVKACRNHYVLDSFLQTARLFLALFTY